MFLTHVPVERKKYFTRSVGIGVGKKNDDGAGVAVGDGVVVVQCSQYVTDTETVLLSTQ
jgi:hypothetical protein